MKKYLIILFAFSLFVLSPQAFAQAPQVAKPTTTKTEKPKQPVKQQPRVQQSKTQRNTYRRKSNTPKRTFLPSAKPKPDAKDIEVSFGCNVYGAILSIDGEELGDANEHYTIKEGEHVAHVEADGFESTDSIIIVDETEDNRYFYLELFEMGNGYGEYFGESFDDWDDGTSSDADEQETVSQQSEQPQLYVPPVEEPPVELIDMPNETIMVKGIPIVMVHVQGGTYTRFKVPDNVELIVRGNVRSGLPSAHKVTLSSYYISQYEVTQELWHAVMDGTTVEFGPQYPFDEADWDQCQEFIAKLNELTGKHFRLPTDAEWEFAARGGVKSNGYVFSGSNNIDEVAWYSNNYDGVYHDVGTKAPNELGIYDMTGSVPEWCDDWWWYWPDVNEQSAPLVNPRGQEYHGLHVIRGGGYGQPEDCCVFRLFNNSGTGTYGFRLAF